MYNNGYRICWPAFSSASMRRATAEEFIARDSGPAPGTLFFLQSLSARHIAKFSRYPEEEEVLFRPNTVFQITSSVQGCSDIQFFYSNTGHIMDIDNIAMQEQATVVATSNLYAHKDWCTNLLIQVCFAAAGLLLAMPAPTSTCCFASEPNPAHSSFLQA